MIYNRKWFNPQLAFKKLPDVATFPNGKIRLQSSLLPNLTQTIILLYYDTLGLSFFEMDEVKKQEWFPRRVWKYQIEKNGKIDFEFLKIQDLFIQ